MHAITNCGCTKELWDSLIPANMASIFYSLGKKEWIMWLLRSGYERGEATKWSERMLIVCWLQWHWRNTEIFEGQRLDVQQRLRQVIQCFEKDDLVYRGVGAQIVGLRHRLQAVRM